MTSSLHCWQWCNCYGYLFVIFIYLFTHFLFIYFFKEITRCRTLAHVATVFVDCTRLWINFILSDLILYYLSDQHLKQLWYLIWCDIWLFFEFKIYVSHFSISKNYYNFPCLLAHNALIKCEVLIKCCAEGCEWRRSFNTCIGCNTNNSRTSWQYSVILGRVVTGIDCTHHYSMHWWSVSVWCHQIMDTQSIAE